MSSRRGTSSRVAPIGARSWRLVSSRAVEQWLERDFARVTAVHPQGGDTGTCVRGVERSRSRLAAPGGVGDGLGEAGDQAP